MLGSELGDIKELKQKATGVRNLGRYSQALNMFDKAITGLKTLEESGRLDKYEASNVRAELADTYGMKGGVYRRWVELPNHLDLALEQYRKGLEIERIDKRSTYNASNVISLAITQDRKPLDVGLLEELDRVIQRLEVETKGDRADEFWAWADLAQFYLLRNDAPRARSGYKQALERGPTAEERQRYVDILRGLAQATQASSPELAQRITAFVEEIEQSQTR